MNKFSVVYADPAWSYSNKGTRAAADNHYPTTSIADLKRLPVWDLAADDSVLFMWWVPPMPLEAIELARAWDFKVKNMCAFTWAKLNQNAFQNWDRQLARHHEEAGAVDSLDFMEMLNAQTRMGLGNYSRSNAENCLVAVRGNGLERLAANVKQMVYAPVSEHSAKPEEVRHRIEQLYGDVPRVELFARGTPAPGWVGWGNECEGSLKLNVGGFADA